MMAENAQHAPRAALLVVDMQEDFCPPRGPLAVEGARELAPLINELLSHQKFVVKIATQDYHPTNHISFAINNPGPNNQPFKSWVQMKNPVQAWFAERKATRVWPVHCVEDSRGSSIIPEIDADKIDVTVHKGMHRRVEMYSAFEDAFGNNPVKIGAANKDIEQELKSRDVTDIFIVGVAGDYCVKYTAIDAAKRGWRVWVIEEGTRCIDTEIGWTNTKEELEAHGAVVIHSDAPELARIRASS